MTATSPKTNRRPPVRRFDRKGAQPGHRQCVPDPAFREHAHRRAFRDDGSRTPPAGDPLFPKR